MKLWQWLFSSLIGASLAGWLCVAEFVVLSSDYHAYYSKHTLTGPLARSIFAGAILALALFPLRTIYSTRSLRRTSAYMATGIATAALLFAFLFHFHFNIFTPLAGGGLLLVYAFIQYACKSKHSFIFSSFYSPIVHACSCVVLLSIVLYCAIDKPNKESSPLPNVLIVSIDDALASHLGCYKYHRATSPNIDTLASEGIIYDNFTAADQLQDIAHSIESTVSNLNESYTSCLVTGNQPLFNASNFDENLDFSQTTLDNRLSANFFNRKRSSGDRAQIAATALFINNINRSGKPFFLVYNLQNCNAPQSIPETAKGHFSGASASETERLISEYDECLWYQDRLLADLLKELDNRDLREDTLIVICGTSTPYSFEHDRRLPLIIRYPKLVAAGGRNTGKLTPPALTNEIKRLLSLSAEQHNTGDINNVSNGE